MDKLVSLIIPVYKDKDYIERCLFSAINQTYRNLEIIIVNDGSKDGSMEIVNRIKNQDPRIMVINKENGGLSDARNAGLKVFKGDYVYFLDADDYLHEKTIEFLVNVTDKCDVDIVYHLTNNGNRFPMILESDIELKKQDDAIASYLRGENFSESCCAKLFKRYIFEELRFDVGKIYEDAFITYRILNIINTIAVTKFNGYIGTNRVESITHAKYSDKNYDMVEANRNIFNFYKDSKYRDSAYNKYIGALCYFILITNRDSSIKKNKIAKNELRIMLKQEGVGSLKPSLRVLAIVSKLGLIGIYKLKQ